MYVSYPFQLRACHIAIVKDALLLNGMFIHLALIIGECFVPHHSCVLIHKSIRDLISFYSSGR